ncbi:MAG: hypothetical protein ACYC99_09935 [Candidatus Geothermincolia bacterium]
MAEGMDIRGRERSRWQRWRGYAIGIVIEVAAVVAISLMALLILYVVKVIIT